MLMLLVSAACSAVNIILLRVVEGINNHFVLHVYTASEFVLLALLYQLVLRTKKAIAIVAVAFLLFKICDVIFITGINQVDNLAVSIESVVMICLSLLCFSRLMSSQEGNLLGVPLFWINSGILIYFSSNFFLFAYSSHIFDELKEYYFYWSIHNILVVVRDILFTIAMVMIGRESSKTNRHKELTVYE